MAHLKKIKVIFIGRLSFCVPLSILPTSLQLSICFHISLLSLHFDSEANVSSIFANNSMPLIIGRHLRINKYPDCIFYRISYVANCFKLGSSFSAKQWRCIQAHMSSLFILIVYALDAFIDVFNAAVLNLKTLSIRATI